MYPDQCVIASDVCLLVYILLLQTVNIIRIREERKQFIDAKWQVGRRHEYGLLKLLLKLTLQDRT
jgi:hypothetical protein